jgi:hypothetical protein
MKTHFRDFSTLFVAGQVQMTPVRKVRHMSTVLGPLGIPVYLFHGIPVLLVFLLLLSVVLFFLNSLHFYYYYF